MILNMLYAGGSSNNNNNITFSYTGNCTIEDNIIRFVTSGILKFTKDTIADVFIVGGGGGGGTCQSRYVSGSNIDSVVTAAGGGGGGGYTRTELNIQFGKNVENTISIGAGGAPAAQGGATSIGIISVDGGFPGGQGHVDYTTITGAGGNGGSGGGIGYGYQSRSDSYIVYKSAGGVDGGNGASTNSTNYVHPGAPGVGQGTTTRLFGKTDGELFASGGVGGGDGWNPNTVTNALDNTGNGGDGGHVNHIKGAYGGSGIAFLRFPEGAVLIRNLV